MAVILNINGSEWNQEQEYQIEGVTFFINTYFNKRSGWYLDIYDSDKTLTLAGLRCMPNGLLTHRYSRSTGLFTGDIMVADTSPVKGDNTITFDNFGQNKRYQLWYFTKEEMDLYQFPPYLV